MEIRHNFCINTRVRKAEVFFLKKTKTRTKTNASDDTTLYPKKATGAIQNVFTRGERLPDQKGLSYFLSLCFLHVSWPKPGSSMAPSQGIRMVLLGLCLLCPVWRERVKQLLLQTLPMLPCFSCHYLNRQIPITALTQQCLSLQQCGDITSIASGSVPAKWRQAGLAP